MAKNVVAAELADKCEVQVSYAIGRAAATSINVSTYGTCHVPEEEISRILSESGIFDFRPGMISKALGLLAPQGWHYRDTASYGHFGRPEVPWERLDKVDALRAAAGL